MHARIALGKPLARRYRLLQVADGKAIFNVLAPKPEEVRREVSAVLLEAPQAAIATLGFSDFNYYADAFAASLNALGDAKTADEVKRTKAKVAPYGSVPPATAAE
jgi:hypothetical protein